MKNVDIQSYHHFMNLHLFSHIDIKLENINIPNGELDLDKIITHTFPMSKIDEAMKLMGSGNCGKIVIDPRG